MGATKMNGHKARSVFDRSNISSEDNLREAAKRLNRYMQEKKVTLSVTPEIVEPEDSIKENSQPLKHGGGGEI